MRRQISFLLIVALALLAACTGNQRFTPLAQEQRSSARAGAQALPFVPSGLASRASGTCNAPEYKPAAGPFIVFIANGKVKHGTFKSASSPTTLWWR